MNTHDIQPASHLRVRPKDADVSPDVADVHRSAFHSGVHLAVLGSSVLACSVGALGSMFLLSVVALYGERVSWGFVVKYGIWDSLPYAFLLFPIWYFRHSLPASIFMAALSASVCGFGLLAMHDGLSPAFRPVPPDAPCGFVSLIVVARVPLLQCAPVLCSWLLVGLVNEFGSRQPDIELDV